MKDIHRFGLIMVFSIAALFSMGFRLQTDCEYTWFFEVLTPEDCPADDAVETRGSIMQFERGYMIWLQSEDAIYVLYTGERTPRWEAFDDTFIEGMPETDPDLESQRPPYTFQPRRGMGKVWREQDEVRRRLGWAVAEYEFPYTVQVQSGEQTGLYIAERLGGLFHLDAEGADWALYDEDIQG